VTRTKLPVVVKERGNLESAKNLDVQNEVEGMTTIIFILPEGTRVKKGDKVAELDSGTLRDQLINQVITTARAEADFQNALKTREVAEISVKEYLEGTFPQDAMTIEGEQTLAKADRARAEDRLKYSTDMAKLGYISPSQKLADEQALMKAKISEDQAVEKSRVLMKYTKPKTETELQANVEKARSDELAKKAALSLEKQKQAKLEKQIEKCVLLAPNDGLVVYANDPNQFRGNNTPQIEEGAQVRERQKIFSLPDIGHMQVNAKIHETMVNMVQPGLPARVRVESNTTVLDGTVKSVAPLPDPSSFFTSDVKMYTTLVSIDTEGLTNLRPGMSAEVEILVTQLDNIVAVPVQAILEFQGKDHVFVLTPDGPRRREVKLGISNDKMVEVKEGVQANDQVAMNPTALLSEEERREVFSPNAKTAAKKEWTKTAAAVVSPGLAPGAAAPGAPDAKDKAKGKAKGKRAGGGGMFGSDPALKAVFDKIPQEDRRKMFMGSADERAETLKSAGATDAQIQQIEEGMSQMRERMQSGGGGPPGGGFGGGRGPGGPGGGGPPQ